MPEFFRKCLVHIRRDQPALSIGELEYLFYQIRASEEKLFIGHEEDSFDRIVEMAVHLRHLKLVLKV